MPAIKYAEFIQFKTQDKKVGPKDPFLASHMFIALLNYLVSEIEKDIEDEDGTPSIFELMDQSILSPFFSENVLYSSNSVKIVFKFLEDL